jgi:serine/threonine protein kinase
MSENEKDKPEDVADSAGRADTDAAALRPGDKTIFRQDDATRRAPRPPAEPAATASGEATVIRGRASGFATDAAAHQVSGSDATRSMQRPDQQASPSFDPTVVAASPGKTRVRPVGHASPDGYVHTPNVEQFQVLKGRFTLEKVIGVGGMGVVYKASDRLKVEAHDREPYVAIKVLSEEFKAHPESFIALQRESRKTQRMAHPNVVKVFDFDRDGDIVFMTMEYMEGRPLDELIKQYSATGLPHNDAWNIMHGLCSALIHAHEENIVHSDFKPGNIFITDAGMPKIFDFGIARAVANVDRHSGRARDVTVFDAGSLGALTPAYASMEMLLGKEPDVRDDIYALGCIAYEVLTGEHPYNRLPADEAYKSGLKPRKITGIKRRQWKAIEKALAFKREERAGSVKEFYEEILSKAKPSYILAAALSIVVTIALATYLIVTDKSSSQNQSALQLTEIEFGIRYNLFKEKIEKLMREPNFSDIWENSIWEEVSGMQTLLGERKDAWFTSATDGIYQAYIKAYNESLGKMNYRRAEALLANAYRYTTDKSLLDAEKEKLAALLLAANAKIKTQPLEQGRPAEPRAERPADDTRHTSIFDQALKNVNQQLSCQSNLSMRDFGVAVDKLRSVDQVRYRGMEQTIIATLAACITKTGKSQPERAQEAKNYALRIFPNNSLIAGISISPREACSKSLAGLGGRGDAAVCRDSVQGISAVPALVVVPGSGNMQAFAIGKYEVSVKEINQFCNTTKTCKPLNSADEGYPATNIRIDTALDYARWLSRITSQRYRLPTRTEWQYAANATSRSHDPNRNCVFSTHGIEKGGQLVRVGVGARNSWGLVNYLGNSQEWVYDKSRNLVAVGGSFEDAMERCNVDSVTSHSGSPDGRTGFRVVREIAQ